MSLPLNRRLNAMYAWLLSRVGDRDEVRRLLRGGEPRSADAPEQARLEELKPRRHTPQEEAQGFAQFVGTRSA